MCGIVGMVADHDVTPVLMEGLQRLEYRGYDSAGLALVSGGKLRRLRRLGKVQALQDALNGAPLSGSSGIAHTRWATHGRPSEANAHPHTSGGVAVVHNGIIENHAALRELLEPEGYEFRSDTDTEVIAHRVHYHLQRTGDLRLAVSLTVPELEGGHASMVVLTRSNRRATPPRRHPGLVVAAAAAQTGGVGRAAPCRLRDDSSFWRRGTSPSSHERP